MSQDISPEVIKRTQKTLGKFVKKPPLTEKLLKKPPFRFLLDIVKTVINETGFLDGLYGDDELKIENIAEKAAKVAFLNKLIDAVTTLTNSNIQVKASKIVAGLEPTNTNLLLQCIGKALESKVDSTQYVSHQRTSHEVPKKKNRDRDDKLKSSSKIKLARDGNKKGDEISKSKNINNSPKEKTSSHRDNKIKIGTPKDRPKNKKIDDKRKVGEKETNNTEILSPKVETSSENFENGVDQRQIVNNNETSPSAPISEGIELNLSTEDSNRIVDTSTLNEHAQQNIIKESDTATINDTITSENRPKSSSNLIRPKSARPKSAAKPNQEEIIKPLEVKTSKTVPKSALLRPPSARPPSARPAAPRLQARPDSGLPIGEPIAVGGGVSIIVEGADDVADEEGTVVIEETDHDLDIKNDSTADMMGKENLSQENKGQLVEQILEQIGEEESKIDLMKTKVEMEWENEALAKGGVAKEITQLRNLVQNITKTASPLGKLMSYLHEDIEAMYSELKMWSNTRNQLFSEINKQKRLNEESTKPLYVHLNQLQEDIKKQQHEILDLQNNVQRNDLKIKDLLCGR